MDYLDLNREAWNKRTEVHIDSEFYDVEGFLKGNSSLNSIELDLLGDVSGKSILHLQCHFGQDSLSLSRLGAKVTGVDLSDKAIDFAKELAEKVNSDAKFICCDVYSLPEHLSEKFDIVYTSYGTIGWLPDLDKWGKLIAQFLKPGGEFVFVEFHPFVWMFDDDFTFVKYPYFQADPIIETSDSTYSGGKTEGEIKDVSWNHSLSDVLTSLLQNGLQLESFEEFDYSPYACFNHTKEIEKGKYIIEPLGEKLPLVYGLKAIKGN
jgi:SAM-dependent methyltransferase